jgi:MFS family permease
MSTLKTPLEETDVKITNEGLIITTMASVAISLSSHMHATSLTTLTTGTVTRTERGGIIGLEHSLFSLARVVGPPLGTALLASGIWRVIWICVIMDLVLMICLKVWSVRKHSKILVDREMIDDGEPLINENDHDHSD